MLEIQRVWRVYLQVYAVDKVWWQLQRERIIVVRCTVERLNRNAGLQAVVRGNVVRTTTSDPITPCRSEMVDRQFRAKRTRLLGVCDFT